MNSNVTNIWKLKNEKDFSLMPERVPHCLMSKNKSPKKMLLNFEVMTVPVHLLKFSTNKELPNQ